jgi:hemerythrin superfamily protein
MSMLEKVVAAITPNESDHDRREARTRARDLALQHAWLASVLEHHERIEEAFADVARTDDGEARREAQKRLGLVLTAHSIAEEAVVYPALAQVGERGDAASAYKEQAEAKMHMAELERIEPTSAEYLEKLEAIRKAVAHHVYEEEGTWFVELANKASAADQGKLKQRYEEEFERYLGDADDELGGSLQYADTLTQTRTPGDLDYGTREGRGR